MLNIVFLLLFFVPIAALVWRLVVSKTRAVDPRRSSGGGDDDRGGAFVVFDDLGGFSFKDWRADIALIAAMSGSAYLLAWSSRHGNSRHRTISMVAAVIGLVPVVGAVATTLPFGGQGR
jgi:hypothetical protein